MRERLQVGTETRSTQRILPSLRPLLNKHHGDGNFSITMTVRANVLRTRRRISGIFIPKHCCICINNDLYGHKFPESMMLAYFICHLVGVSSCCTNPILYGFLNPNFSNVFLQFYHRLWVRIKISRQLVNLQFLPFISNLERCVSISLII